MSSGIIRRNIEGYVLRIVMLLSLSIIVNETSAQVIISEIMPLNISVLQDQDGEYSDWIELHNTGTTVVSLNNWSLTDDPEIPDKWIFPNKNLSQGEYIVVFASGKNKVTDEGEIHTNFSLNGDGEYLSLIYQNQDTVSIFSPEFPPVRSDYSYGYLDGKYTTFAIATPGSVNLESGVVLENPVFTTSHGIFSESFTLELSSQELGASIYYTTDGRIPDESTGVLYTSGLLIDSTTIFRAMAYTGSHIPSEVVTNTYIFPGKVIAQPNNPTGFPNQWGPWTQSAGRAYADYEMDPEMMADPAFAARVEDGLKFLPSVSLVTDPDHFFSMDTDPEKGGIYMYPAPGENDIGRGWERPVSVEFFNEERTESFQVNCGIQIHGGESRRPEKTPRHSFRLLFRGEYGPSKLNYPVFGDDYLQKFNVLILRASFGNSWTHWKHSERNISQNIRDIWMKDSQREMYHPSGNAMYSHLYINGIYWGIYTPSERINADFAAEYMGGDTEDYDIIKDFTEVAAGNNIAWNTLMAKANAGLVSNEAYQDIQGNFPDGTTNPISESLVDVVSLADYMLLNFYGGNTDWDHHNWVAARNRINPGTGFQFFSWDAEHVLEQLSHNMVNENNNNCPSHLFQQLRQNENFKRLFADRVQKFCYNGGVLSPETAVERWMKRSQQIEPALECESARWGDYRRDVHPYSVAPYELYTYDDQWLTQQNFILNTYFPNRTSTLIGQLRNAGLFPNVDAPLININDQVFTGKYVSRGDKLDFTSSEGVIYYTTNGTDPAVWTSQDQSGAYQIVSQNATKKVLVPTQDVSLAWRMDLNFDDSQWLDCVGTPGGIGYEKSSGYESLISLDVGNKMFVNASQPNNSCFIRIPFTIDDTVDLGNFLSLILSLHYDDGFVAWLNGTMVAESNAPTSLTWNSAASDQNEAVPDSPVSFNISENISVLKKGENLLTIQGLNLRTTSTDFIITASLNAYDTQDVDISSDAMMYSGSLSVDSSMHVVARTFSNSNWSARHDRYLTIPSDYHHLKITEIHYHPEPIDSVDDDNFEFIEIKNTGNGVVDLGGVSLTDGIRYVFEPETQMLPEQFIVLASDYKWFKSRYDFEPHSYYKGKLSNSGERIVLLSPIIGDTICSINYLDDAPWPLYTDGEGLSMVPIDLNPLGNLKTPDQWRASLFRGGSPGTDDVDTISHIQQHHKGVEQDIMLAQNYPNPVFDITYFSYRIPERAHIELSVYTLTGKKIITLENAYCNAGMHTVSWNIADHGNILPAGVYLYRLKVYNGNISWQSMKKFILL